MQTGRNEIQTFEGIDLDKPAAKLPPQLFQEDVGGDRFKRGSWKRRRGMRRICVLKRDNPIETLLGFELGGPGFGLLLVEDGNALGGTDMVVQP